MKINSIIDESMFFYKKPAMLLNCQNIYIFNKEKNNNFSDEKILKRFSENPRTKAIVIGNGIEPMNNMTDLRSFIFSARKFFDPNNRPTIIILTNYSMEELKNHIWSGVESEILQYGNVILRCGKYKKERAFYSKSFGIPLKKDQHIYLYIGHNYE